MSQYKKQVAFLFGAIALITYLSVRYFSFDEGKSTPVISVKEEEEHLQIFLLDSDQTLVPLSIPVSAEMSEEDKLQLMVSYMSGKQKVENFYPLFTKECKATNVTIQKGVATLDFDDSLKNYKKENELRVLEALAWGATQFHDVEQVKLLLNHQALTKMPLANTPIPSVLNRSIGINHFETSTTALHKSKSTTVFAAKKIAGKQYMVPRSKRVQGSGDEIKASINQILSDLSVSGKLTQPLYDDGVQIKNFSFDNGVLVLDLNGSIIGTDKTVKKDAYQSLVLSLSALEAVEKVQVKVDGVVVSLNDHAEAVSIYDLSYNEVMF